MSRPRMYWSGVVASSGQAELIGDDAHRLRDVLRLAPGDPIALFDGLGHEWVGQVTALSKQRVEVSGLAPVTPVAETHVPITLAVGVLKGDQMDAVVRDATMLGAAAIIPLRTEHVTVPPRAWQSGLARDRWQRVAIASATQCRRAVVPDVRPVTDFGAVLLEPAALRLICVEPDTGVAASDWAAAAPPASVQVLIGPEGGWSGDEVALALAAGAKAMSLGPRTLRAETAPIVALSLVSAAWGW